MSRETGKMNIEKIKGEFSEIQERGNEIVNEGENVDSRLKRISMEGMDPDDIAVKESVDEGMRRDYQNEVQESVTETTDEVKSEGKSEISGLESDKSRIDDAKNEYTEIAGMSEIGSENAEKGASKMEQSSAEYSDIINDGNSAMEKADENARKIEDKISALF